MLVVPKREVDAMMRDQMQSKKPPPMRDLRRGRMEEREMARRLERNQRVEDIAVRLKGFVWPRVRGSRFGMYLDDVLVISIC